MHHVADHLDAPASSASASATLRDPRDLACSTRSSAAVRQVEAALESMLSYFGDPLAALDHAIEQDPAWPHPRVLKAAVLLTLAEFGPAEQARELLRSTPEAPATGRERAHRAAAQAAADGDWDLACRRWEVLLAEHPRDIAALLFAHLFDFYRGDALNLKRRPQRVLPAWSPELPLYGYVLGMQAFGLEEAGHYAQAEDAGQAALAHNPRDPWAVHAVTHVYEMQGRHAQGTGWLASREADWAPDNGFAFHNWFHAALFQLERLDTQGALATYDAHLAPPADMALQRVDATAILWRLKLLGADVADRFEALRTTWSTQPPDSGFYAFNDVHALLAHLGARTEVHGAACKRLLQALQDGTSSGPSNRQMAQSVGLPLAQALMHYAQERWDEAADGLMAVRDGAHRFGGSHAQRDILTLTLLDAATRAGRTKLAAHVLNERCPEKAATPLTSHWRERIGERAGAMA